MAWKRTPNNSIAIVDIGVDLPNGYNGDGEALYWYTFRFSAQGTEHTLLGLFFMNAPGYAQIWRWTGSAWISVGGIDYLDQINTSNLYGINLTTQNGYRISYTKKTTDYFETGTGTITAGILMLLLLTV